VYVHHIRQALIAGLFVVVSAACGGSGGSNSSNLPTDPTGGGSSNNNNNGGTSRSLSVTVTSTDYTPGTTTVAKGSTVQWTWNTCTSDGYGYGGQTCVEHTVTFDDGTTSELQDKGTFARTFNAAGTYTYHCKVHGTAMSGQVRVE
jgi:plastocyanin